MPWISSDRALGRVGAGALLQVQDLVGSDRRLGDDPLLLVPGRIGDERARQQHREAGRRHDGGDDRARPQALAGQAPGREASAAPEASGQRLGPADEDGGDGGGAEDDRHAGAQADAPRAVALPAHTPRAPTPTTTAARPASGTAAGSRGWGRRPASAASVGIEPAVRAGSQAAAVAAPVPSTTASTSSTIG